MDRWIFIGEGNKFMLLLYLDESGDLGFDFVTKNPSRHFKITILTLNGVDQNRALLSAVKRTLRRKLYSGAELKGSDTNFKIKEYFYKQVRSVDFECVENHAPDFA